MTKNTQINLKFTLPKKMKLKKMDRNLTSKERPIKVMVFEAAM